MIKCLRHIFRPDRRWYIEGWGDCTTCQPDENNEFCDGYRKVNWQEVNIEETNDERD